VLTNSPRNSRRSKAFPLAPFTVAAVIVCALSLAGCGRAGGDRKPPEPGDVAVATVDGQTVWASDVKREAATQGLIAEGDPLDIGSEPFHRVLDEVIDQKLLAAEAARKNLQNDPIARRRIAAARERILGDLLVEHMVEQAVNDQAIKSLYQEQLRLSKQSEEFHARQIIVANEADAAAIRKQLASGAAFEALAMERSTDSATRFNGGDLGYFTADVMPQSYAAALKSAKPGDLIGPFKADAGWVLLKVEDRRAEAPISLDQARPQIVRFLTYDEVRDVLAKLRGQSKIRVLIPPTQAGPAAPTAKPPGKVSP